MKESAYLIGHKLKRIPFSEQMDSLLIETPAHTDGPPPHYHKNYDEAFFILEGQIDFFLNGEWSVKKKGDYVLVPKNNVHTFKNSSDAVVRWLNFHTPKGFADYMFSVAVEDAPNAYERSISKESIERLVKTAGENDLIVAH